MTFEMLSGCQIVMAMTPSPERKKKVDDYHSEASDSTETSDPPQSPDASKLIFRSLKPRELSLTASTTCSGSPFCRPNFDFESLSSPNSLGSISSLLEAEARSSLPPPPELPAHLPKNCSESKGPPPAPSYPAPPVIAPRLHVVSQLPPAPALPPGVPEPPRGPPSISAESTLPHVPGALAAAALAGPSAPLPPPWTAQPPFQGSQAPMLSSAPPTPSGFGFPMLASGPPTPSGSASFSRPGCDASQRSVPVGPSQPPAPEVHSEASEENAILASVLALLSLFLSEPPIPPLPPSGCYGGLLVSSVVSEGLGAEEAKAAQAAADALGERPVKVHLPWYPDVGLQMFDQTQPAKLPDVHPCTFRGPQMQVSVQAPPLMPPPSCRHMGISPPPFGPPGFQADCLVPPPGVLRSR